MKSGNPYRAAGTPLSFNAVPTSHLNSAAHLRWLRVSGFLVAMIGGASVWTHPFQASNILQRRVVIGRIVGDARMIGPPLYKGIRP